MKKQSQEKTVKGGANYSLDSHHKFCKRCFEYNGKCPNTQSERKDKGCAL